MGIMDRLRGKNGDAAPAAPETVAAPLREGVPLGLNQEEPVLVISALAAERIRAVLQAQQPPVRTIRVTCTLPGRYAMSLEPEARPGLDDTVLPYAGFEVYVDAVSLPNVEGASLDWVDTYGGGGFQFTGRPRPRREMKQPPEGPAGDAWRKILEVLELEVNPAVAMHGGHIELLEYRDGVAYVEMSGGCQGCGMASVTLKQGVERLLRQHVPEIEEILDVTDHAGGRNPYYASA
jgi:Fe/S biogenesis protein NfuA